MIKNNNLNLCLPQQVSAKVDDLAAALIKHVSGKSVESSSEKLLEFLTNLIQKTA
jgi:hypothetical protein